MQAHLRVQEPSAPLAISSQQVPMGMSVTPFISVISCLVSGFASSQTFIGLSLILVIGYFFQYLPIIAVEEAYLLESCGRVYQEYRDRVPRFIPRFRSYPEPSPHDFSWTRAIKSEKRTLTAIVCVIGLIFARQLVDYKGL